MEELIIKKAKALLRSVIETLEKAWIRMYTGKGCTPLFIADVRVQQVITALNPKSFTNRIVESSGLILQATELYLCAVASDRGEN